MTSTTTALGGSSAAAPADAETVEPLEKYYNASWKNARIRGEKYKALVKPRRLLSG